MTEKKKSTVIISVILAIILIGTLILISIEGGFMHRSYLEPWDEDYYTNFEDERTQIIAHGILAANGHNLQNWRFRYDPDNDRGFDVYVETERLAGEVDPYHTQVFISQGTLFEYMVIAGKQLGYKLNYELFPDGEISFDAGSDELREKRVAHVELEPVEKQNDPLYEELFKPDTSRVAYKKDQIPEETIKTLTDTHGYDLLEVQYISSGEEYEALKEYVIEGAVTETNVERVMQESVDLFRINEFEKNKFRYGFSFEGSALSPINMHVLQIMLTVFPDMNNVESAKTTFLEQTEMAAEENSGFLLITTTNNSRIQQFNAGRLYSQIQLKAHTIGLAVQPMTQPILEYPEMKTVNDKIHADFAGEEKTILMLFRIGEPTSVVPKSMRKDVRSFIEN